MKFMRYYSVIVGITGIALFFCCAERDNKNDPLSSRYHNLPPEIKCILSVDSTRIYSEANDDTLFLRAPVEIRAVIESKDDYEKFGSPSVSWKFFYGDSVLKTETDTPVANLTCDKDGVYAFTATVTDNEGESSDTTLYFKVHANIIPYIVSYTPDRETLFAAGSNTIRFIATVDDSDDTITSFTYMLDTFTIEKKRHHDPEPFSDTVSLTVAIKKPETVLAMCIVADPEGGGDTMTLEFAVVDTATVGNRTPYILSVSAKPQQVIFEEKIEFRVVADDSDGVVEKYVWEFGDGERSKSRQIEHRFTTPGIYPVSITVTDNDGANVSDTVTVVVKDIPKRIPYITEIAAHPDSGVRPLTVDFSVSVIDSDRVIEKVYWEFGDGRIAEATDDSVKHTYNRAGAFPVRCILTGKNWESDTLFDTIRVEDTHTVPVSPTIRGVSVVPDSGFVPLAVEIVVDIEDTSGIVEGYYWEFGDGRRKMSESPAVRHKYYQSGVFPLSLHVWGEQWEYDTIIDTVRVYERERDERYPELVSYSIEPDSGTAPLSVRFDVEIDDPEGIIAGYYWDFGDRRSNVSESASLTHTYFHYGEFPVTLTVWGINWSEEILRDTIRVFPKKRGQWPDYVFDFSASPSVANPDEEIVFWVVVDRQYRDGITYTWYFPDDTLETQSSMVRKKFDTEGVYTVVVMLDDGENEPYAISIEITVISPRDRCISPF
jgi:PKD repeat protein